MVLLSPLSTRTPLGGDLPPVCFVQFRIHVDSSQTCMSRVCTSSEAETCSSSSCPTKPPGCLLGILDLSCPQLSSSPSSQPAALSGTALLSEGNSVLLVAQTRSLESPPMPPFLSHLSSSQSINPVVSASVIPRLRHTHPTSTTASQVQPPGLRQQPPTQPPCLLGTIICSQHGSQSESLKIYVSSRFFSTHNPLVVPIL